MMPYGNQKHSWNVLLIGGNSGSGKTTIARALSHHFDVPWLQVDDLRLALQHSTPAEMHPALHHFLPDGGLPDLFKAKQSEGSMSAWQQSTDALCKAMIDMASIVSRSLEPVIAHHYASNQPVIIEGDGLTPDLAASNSVVGIDLPAFTVRSVFLVESDATEILRSMATRGIGYDDKPGNSK